jgi:hypothetical protein
MRNALVRGAFALGLTVVLGACGDGRLATGPDDTGTPQLNAASGSGTRGPLERIQFIHWQRGVIPSVPEPATEPAAPGDCFAFIATGAKWKGVEPWEVLRGTTDSGISARTVKSRINRGINQWENHLVPSGDILGAGSLGNTPVVLSVPDDHNVVQFGNDPRAGVIAVTNVWGFFSGPVADREIVEWDMILDTDFTWATDGNPSDMDLLNIATHELGHALGMAHPVDTCTAETMYRFASIGETKKRTLHGGDIAGINELY